MRPVDLIRIKRPTRKEKRRSDSEFDPAQRADGCHGPWHGARQQQMENKKLDKKNRQKNCQIPERADGDVFAPSDQRWLAARLRRVALQNAACLATSRAAKTIHLPPPRRRATRRAMRTHLRQRPRRSLNRSVIGFFLTPRRHREVTKMYADLRTFLSLKESKLWRRLDNLPC